MKISPQWVREFVDLKVDDRQLADDLTSAGITVEDIGGEGEGTVYEMEIGTNRPDAMNHYGVARECSAIYDVPLKPIEPLLPLPHGKSARPPSRSDFAIEIEDSEGCARYTARIVRGVTIQPSPAHIAKRLERVDQRPINNVADASNYTLWEMGHPTHAFDLDLLEGGKIIVRRARPGETLKTLDGVERKLSPEDLVIADAKKPVALAGVMGGFDTMITEKTKNILIESAWFDPVAIRKSSRRHGLHTDASHRFERGADYEATSLACGRVAQRILESAGGALQGEEIDAVGRRLDLAPVQLDRAEVKRILGENLSDHEIQRILARLGFTVMPDPEADYLVQIPSWRLDVEREIDLIEELARLHGYDKFANTLPAYTGSVIELPDAEKDRKLRTMLLALGYNEAISLTFISHQDAENFSAVPVIELANPISEEASVMRTSMAPGMLDMLAYNLNRGVENVRLFETGSVYEYHGTEPAEPKRISLGATAGAIKNQLPWAGMLDKSEGGIGSEIFRSFKGDIETLLDAFQHGALSYEAQAAEYYHPGRSGRAVMDGKNVAQFGQVDPDVAAARKLRQDVFVAELYLDRLYEHELRKVIYEALPRYPTVERDFSFIFDDSIVFENIRQSVVGLSIPELRSFVPVEIFRGEKVGSGKYSILLGAKFQSSERTLRDDEVGQWSGAIVKALEGLGGVLRTS